MQSPWPMYRCNDLANEGWWCSLGMYGLVCWTSMLAAMQDYERLDLLQSPIMHMAKGNGDSCCMQAFAISVKGRVRPGRLRSDPKDVTACRYDMAPKLLKASTMPRTSSYLLRP